MLLSRKIYWDIIISLFRITEKHFATYTEHMDLQHHLCIHFEMLSADTFMHKGVQDVRFDSN